jgi:hypothetical protein
MINTPATYQTHNGLTLLLLLLLLSFSTAYFNNHLFSYIKTSITCFTCFHETAARSRNLPLTKAHTAQRITKLATTAEMADKV